MADNESANQHKAAPDALASTEVASEEPKAETPAHDTPENPGITFEPLAEKTTFDTFAACDMRVVHIKDCIAVKKSKKLLQFTLDDGTGTDRTILSGVHAWYEPEDLVGKNAVAIVNIPPRRMMGIDSCGMLLSAVYEQDGKEQLHLLLVDNEIPAGARLC